MKLKGVSLSIQTIIIIVISVLVLAVIVLFFTGTFNPAAEGLTSEANLQKECNKWRRHFYSSDYFFSGNCSNLNSRFNNDATKAKEYCTGMKGAEPPSGATTPPPTSTHPSPGS